MKEAARAARVGIPYKRSNLSERYDVIVIGSGAGGLTAATILAQHAGKRVLVLERHYTPGGMTHVFRRHHHEWATGLHYVGSSVPSLLEGLIESAPEWVPLPKVYDRIRIGGHDYDYTVGREPFIETLRSYFPKEEKAIVRYADMLDEVYDARFDFFGSRAVPRLIGLMAGRWMRRKLAPYTKHTTTEVLRQLTDDPALRGVLSGQWIDYGSPPGHSSFAGHALVASSYFKKGGFYPAEGPRAIANALVPEIQKGGGEVVVSAEVDHVIVRNGRAMGVSMADGREIFAPIVISNAGAVNTFKHLVKGPEPAMDLIRDVPATAACVGVYLALKGERVQAFDDVGNYFIYPTFDHDANVERSWADVNAPFSGLYATSPTSKAPHSHGTGPHPSSIVESMVLVPWSWFMEWDGTRWSHRGDAYESLKQSIADRMVDELAKLIPDLRERLEHMEISSPLSAKHFTNYEQGEIGGLALTTKRLASDQAGPRTAIKNLFLTGQDTVTCGVEGAMFGGVLTASCILGRNFLFLANGRAARRARRM